MKVKFLLFLQLVFPYFIILEIKKKKEKVYQPNVFLIKLPFHYPLNGQRIIIIIEQWSS